MYFSHYNTIHNDFQNLYYYYDTFLFNDYYTYMFFDILYN